MQADVDLAAARLSRAGRLTQALADEKTRWEDSVKVNKQSSYSQAEEQRKEDNYIAKEEIYTQLLDFSS